MRIRRIVAFLGVLSAISGSLCFCGFRTSASDFVVGSEKTELFNETEKKDEIEKFKNIVKEGKFNFEHYISFLGYLFENGKYLSSAEIGALKCRMKKAILKYVEEKYGGNFIACLNENLKYRDDFFKYLIQPINNKYLETNKLGNLKSADVLDIVEKIEHCLGNCKKVAEEEFVYYKTFNIEDGEPEIREIPANYFFDEYMHKQYVKIPKDAPKNYNELKDKKTMKLGRYVIEDGKEKLKETIFSTDENEVKEGKEMKVRRSSHTRLAMGINDLMQRYGDLNNLCAFYLSLIEFNKSLESSYEIDLRLKGCFKDCLTELKKYLKLKLKELNELQKNSAEEEEKEKFPKYTLEMLCNMVTERYPSGFEVSEFLLEDPELCNSLYKLKEAIKNTELKKKFGLSDLISELYNLSFPFKYLKQLFDGKIYDFNEKFKDQFLDIAKMLKIDIDMKEDEIENKLVDLKIQLEKK